MDKSQPLLDLNGQDHRVQLIKDLVQTVKDK